MKKTKEDLKLLSPDFTLDEAAVKIYKNAFEKGFYNEGKSFSDHTSLIISEVMEVFESYRNNTLHSLCNKPIDLTYLEEEIADIIIRVLDFACHQGITNIGEVVMRKHNYNLERDYLHGGKKV